MTGCTFDLFCCMTAINARSSFRDPNFVIGNKPAFLNPLLWLFFIRPPDLNWHLYSVLWFWSLLGAFAFCPFTFNQLFLSMDEFGMKIHFFIGECTAAVYVGTYLQRKCISPDFLIEMKPWALITPKPISTLNPRGFFVVWLLLLHL